MVSRSSLWTCDKSHYYEPTLKLNIDELLDGSIYTVNFTLP